jgi:hypothetical protein
LSPKPCATAIEAELHASFRWVLVRRLNHTQERDALSQWSEERKAAPKRQAARPASNVPDEGVPDGVLCSS